MIIQEFDIKHYWKVIVYYDVDYNFFDDIVRHISTVTSPVEKIAGAIQTLKDKAKGLTISSLSNNISFVLFNKHKSKSDYISSIVHEAEHIKQAILKKYGVKDEGEDAAYTIGYIVQQMYRCYNTLLCSC